MEISRSRTIQERSQDIVSTPESIIVLRLVIVAFLTAEKASADTGKTKTTEYRVH